MDFLPEGLGNIGVYAFENCTGLSLNTFDDYPGFKGIINIPESVTSVGAGAFKNTLIAPSTCIRLGNVLSTKPHGHHQVSAPPSTARSLHGMSKCGSVFSSAQSCYTHVQNVTILFPGASAPQIPNRSACRPPGRLAVPNSAAGQLLTLLILVRNQ